MPTFRVYVEYVSLETGKTTRDNHETSLATPDDARRAALRKYKALAQDGVVYVNKIKRVR